MKSSAPLSGVSTRFARRLGRPVKWVSERGEDFVSSAQGRDNHTRGRLALDADGRFLALAVDTIANLGAYVSTGGPGSSRDASLTWKWAVAVYASRNRRCKGDSS